MTDPTPAKNPNAGILARAQQSATGRERLGVERWLFTNVRDEVAELLRGSPFEVDSYLQAAFRAVERDPKLREATQQAGPTVLGAIMLGATLQLPIGGPLGQFYLTPRSEKTGDGWRTVCVPMIGYRGFFELGYRSGHVSFYDYLIVREGDDFRHGAMSGRGQWFEWSQFADGEYDEEDENGNRRELRGVVALARLTNGDVQHKYMSRTAIDRRRPKNWERSPWAGKDSEAMYVKTPHREMAKFMQLSIASAQAATADETIAEWNKATQSIDTRHDDDTPPAEYGDNAATDAEPRAAAAQATEQPPAGDPEPERVPEPAQRRTAPPSGRARAEQPDDDEFIPPGAALRDARGEHGER